MKEAHDLVRIDVVLCSLGNCLIKNRLQHHASVLLRFLLWSRKRAATAMPNDVAVTLELAVPRDALVLRQNGSFVFRISADNKAEQIKVEIGDSAGELVAVRGALAAGDRVAIRGAENLSEGSDVRILVSETASARDADPGRNSAG